MKLKVFVYSAVILGPKRWTILKAQFNARAFCQISKKNLLKTLTYKIKSKFNITSN